MTSDSLFALDYIFTNNIPEFNYPPHRPNSPTREKVAVLIWILWFLIQRSKDKISKYNGFNDNGSNNSGSNDNGLDDNPCHFLARLV